MASPSNYTPPAGYFILGLVVNLLFVFAGASIAVAWHRFILLGEVVPIGGANLFTRYFWRYILAGFKILALASIPSLTVALPIAMHHAKFWGIPVGVWFGISVICQLVGIAVLFRLSPLLPASATTETAIKLNAVWLRTRGNAWRLFAGLALSSVPPILIFQLASYVIFGLPSPRTFFSADAARIWAASSAIFSSYGLLTLPIPIGFLALAYRHIWSDRLPA